MESAVVWGNGSSAMGYLEQGRCVDGKQVLQPGLALSVSKEGEGHGKGGFIVLSRVPGMAPQREGKQNH